ncbi:MAG: hypothetical protein QOE19_1874 [Actinomycetota bacterium]|jgi:hypothetical protein|nr:hypothetical protein [Actinomycetota bacterium]MDQ1664210.1 hypothetical protein [Actinomycetota bacterium]
MADPVTTHELDDEDAKLLTLARATRARAHAAEGAAVRDDIGRTYAAATVALPSLQLTALQAAVAAAMSSGAERLEAALVLGDAVRLSQADVALVKDLSPVTVWLTAADGSITAVE